MREYGLIHSCFWTSDDILALSDDGKMLALYLIAGPHTTMLGCFRLPYGYVVEDLHWTEVRVTQGFAELFRNGFATVDKQLHWLVIHQFIKWNPIENPNQGKQAARLFDQIPDKTCVKPILARHLAEWGKHLPEPFRNRLLTLAEPFRNQEQEQEQDIYRPLRASSGEVTPDPVPRVDEQPPANGHHVHPEVVERHLDGIKPYLADAADVLSYLNKTAGKAFLLRNPKGKITASARLVIDRLKEGYSRTDLREVVYDKAEQWRGDAKMHGFLRPETLFSKRNFEQYLGELRGQS